MASGAQSGDVLKLVLWCGLALKWAGVGLGVPGALARNRLKSSLLFGVTADDPATRVREGFQYSYGAFFVSGSAQRTRVGKTA